MSTEPDKVGHFGVYGGRYVGETLMPSLIALDEAYREAATGIFPVISETNLRATLGILARTVAPGAARPGADDPVG